MYLHKKVEVLAHSRSCAGSELAAERCQLDHTLPFQYFCQTAPSLPRERLECYDSWVLRPTTSQRVTPSASRRGIPSQTTSHRLWSIYATGRRSYPPQKRRDDLRSMTHRRSCAGSELTAERVPAGPAALVVIPVESAITAAHKDVLRR